MSHKYPNSKHNPRARTVLLLGLYVVMLLLSVERSPAQQTYNGRTYYDAVSKMQAVISDSQSNLYSSLMRANAARGDFKEMAGASKITQQEIQNLCKPFPCGNEATLNRQPAQQAYTTVVPNYPTAAPNNYPITATDFQPAGDRIVPDEFSRNAQCTVEQKEMLRNMNNQFLDAFERSARKNNIASSFAFLAEASLMVATGRELTQTEQQQLISAFNNSLASTPQWLSMSSRDKQVLHETLIVTGGIMVFLHMQGKQNNDAGMQADAQKMAKVYLGSLFGIKLK
jgi:hypothetical protein